jgi:hypothetical protein
MRARAPRAGTGFQKITFTFTTGAIVAVNKGISPISTHNKPSPIFHQSFTPCYVATPW